MNRRNLRFSSLRAFEATARHSSLSKAAAELGVSHSAISHQIRQLETQIGAELFTRSSRGVRLTAKGQHLLPVLRESFDRIEMTLARLSNTATDDALYVTTTPTFATRWLIPRLSQWQALDTGITLHLLPTLEFLALEDGEADVAIRCGRPPWPGLKSDFLQPIQMTPVCSPAFSERLSPLRVEDVLKVDLIHADIRGHALGEEWQMWLTAAGVTDVSSLPGLSFHDPGLALEAALDGLGIAIGYLDLIQPEIEASRLVCPYERIVEHYFSYYLVYPKSRASEKAIGRFKTWVQAACAPAPQAPAR